MEKLRLSKSKVTSYNMCPRQYYFRHVKNIYPKEMPQMVLGKNLHEKYETFYRHLPKVIKNTAQIKKIYKRFCKPHENTKEKTHLANFLNMNLTTFEDLKKKELLNYFNPIAVEKKYYDEDLDFVGVIDAVFQLQDKILVVDWKSSYYKEGKESNYRFELAGYKHLWDKFNPDKPATHWGIGFSGNNVFWTEPVNQRSMLAMYKKIEATKKLILEGKFEKKKNAPCQWCGYYDMCWENGENV